MSVAKVYMGALPFIGAGALVAATIKVYRKHETPMEAVAFAAVSTLAWPLVLPTLGVLTAHSAWTGQKHTFSFSWSNVKQIE